MSFYKIRPRSGTKAQWETANTILAEREIGYELPDGGVGTGVVKMKMGDGVTAWNDLPYAIPIYLSPDDIVQDATTDSSVKVPSASVTKNLQDQVTALNDSLSDYYTKNEVDTKLSKAGKKSAIVILSQTINTYVYSSMIPLDNATKYNITITGITIAWVGKVSDLSGIIIRKENDGWYFETTNTELANRTAYACVVSYTVS